MTYNHLSKPIESLYMINFVVIVVHVTMMKNLFLISLEDIVLNIEYLIKSLVPSDNADDDDDSFI